MEFNDIAAVRRLVESTEGLSFNEEETDEALSFTLSKNYGLSHVAEIDGVMVGCVFVGDTGLRGMINHLAVHPSARKRGVARKLVHASMKALFVSSPTRRVYSSVLKNNDAAYAFWTAMGFADWTNSGEGAKVHTFVMDLSPEKHSWLG